MVGHHFNLIGHCIVGGDEKSGHRTPRGSGRSCEYRTDIVPPPLAAGGSGHNSFLWKNGPGNATLWNLLSSRVSLRGTMLRKWGVLFGSREIPPDNRNRHRHLGAHRPWEPDPMRDRVSGTWGFPSGYSLIKFPFVTLHRRMSTGPCS